MANKIVEVLTEIERGRKNCIKNARLANFDIPDSIDFFSIGELFKYKNTEHPIPDGMWDIPEEWAQLRDAIETLPNITVGDKTYKPFFTLILDTSEDTTIFSYTTTSHCLFGDLYVTSDGAQYVSNGADVSHTWDKTKDLYSDTLELPYRYVTIYNERDFSEYTVSPTNVIHVQLGQYPALAYIQKKGTSIVHSNGTFCSLNATDCYSLLYVQICGWTKAPASKMFANATNLRRIDFYGSTTSTTWDSTFMNCSQLQVIYGHDSLYAAGNASSSSTPFRGCSSLAYFIFPHLKEWPYYTNTADCPMTYFYAPELEKICSPIELPCARVVDLPGLKEIYSSIRNTAIIANAAEVAYFNNLVSLNDSANAGYPLIQAGSLKELYIPKLESLPAHSLIQGGHNLTITAPVLKTICRFGYDSAYSGVGAYRYYAVNSGITWHTPALTTVTSVDAFNGYGAPVVELKPSISYPDNLNFADKSILVVKLYDGWDKSIKLTGIGLRKASIVDALNKLATVPSSANKKVTLGTNLAKLTDSEKAIATSKGWTLSA